MERDTSVKSRNPGRGLVDRQQSSRDEFIRTLTNLGHKCELESQTRYRKRERERERERKRERERERERDRVEIRQTKNVRE